MNLDDLADLHGFVGILDVAVGQFADVHESVLVHADVDECAELGDVGHHAFERHAGEQVRDLFHFVAELRCDKLLARVAAGLLEFIENVAEGVDADGKALFVRFFE